MSELLERLLVVLASEENLYRRMRALLQRETEVIASLDGDAFAAIIREKEELADEGRLFEEARIVLASELASQLGVAAPRPRLADLCKRLGPEAASLRKAHNGLVVIVGIVRELLEANANLARDTLGHVRSTLVLLGGPVSNQGYAPKAAGATPGQLLRRSA